MKKNIERTRNKKKISLKAWTRLIFIFLSLSVLIIGFILSGNSFLNNYTLGQDYGDHYEALVGVYNNKIDNKIDGQPNGDNVEGAKILSDRLNPLGMKDIRITRAGKNYLKVSASKNDYNSINEFKNNIQKSGSVIMTDDTFQDIELTSSSSDTSTAERTAISDYFSSANATTQTISSKKSPYISYDLNGTNFTDLISSKTSSSDSSSSNETKQMNLYIFTDLNKLFIDFREYYNYDTNSYSSDIEKFNSYWKDVVTPLQTIYNNAINNKDYLISSTVYDMFRYKLTKFSSSGHSLEPEYGSLVANDGSITSASALEKVIDEKTDQKETFEFTSDTNSYVYDATATTDDFKVDGKYGKSVNIYRSKKEINSDYKIDKIFNSLNSSVISTINKSSDKSFVRYFQDNYLLFNGSLTSTQTSSESTQAFFLNNKFYTLVDTQSRAKQGASIFNAATAGFNFVTSNVSTVNSLIKSIQFILAILILLVLLLALFTFMLIAYRLLAVFTIIISLTSISLTMLIVSSGFNLSIGLDSILGVVILLGISFATASLLFNVFKTNIFLNKRGIKSSFNIASKDMLSFGIDILVALIVTGSIMFMLGSNSLKSFATIISIGSCLSLLLSLLFGTLLMKAIIKTNIFEKHKWLLVLNIDTDSGNVIREYILYRLESKKQKLIKKQKDYKKIDDKIIKIQEKMAKSDEKSSKWLEKVYKKQELSVNKKIEKFSNKKTELLSKDFKLNKIEKIEKAILKNNDKISELNKLIFSEKLDKVKDKLIRKINKIKNKNLQLENSKTKIKNLKELNVNKIDLKIELLKYFMSEEYHELKIEKDDTNTGNYTIRDKINIKSSEKKLRLGSKIVMIIFAIISGIAIILGSTVGMNLDKTFGGAVVYTYWGSNVINQSETELTVITESSNLPDWYKQDAQEVLESFKEESANAIINKYDTSYSLNTVKLLSSFLKETLENSSILSSLTGNSFSINLSVTEKYGLNYTNGISQQGTEKWFSLEVNVKNSDESVNLKDKLLYKFIPVSDKSNVYDDSGFVSKRLHPYTSLKVLKQFVAIVLISVLILFIYIVIRFKWTYYVALALSVILAAVVCVSFLEVFWIPIDLSLVLFGVASFVISISMGMYTIAMLRSVMARKDVKSLTKFFEKQIDVRVEIKQNRKEARNQIRVKRLELKLWLKEQNKKSNNEDKFAKKLEFRQFKLDVIENLRKQNRIKNEEVRRESRKNNYLYEVVHKVFLSLSKKIMFLLVPVVVVFVAITLASPGWTWSNSVAILIDYIITGVICLFILIPCWVKLEGFRIHRKLSNKKFINQIEVSQEEQIVEDIND